MMSQRANGAAFRRRAGLRAIGCATQIRETGVGSNVSPAWPTSARPCDRARGRARVVLARVCEPACDATRRIRDHGGGAFARCPRPGGDVGRRGFLFGPLPLPARPRRSLECPHGELHPARGSFRYRRRRSRRQRRARRARGGRSRLCVEHRHRPKRRPRRRTRRRVRDVFGGARCRASCSVRGGFDSDKTELTPDAHFFVRDALDDLLAGRPVRAAEGKTLGCTLRRRYLSLRATREETPTGLFIETRLR